MIKSFTKYIISFSILIGFILFINPVADAQIVKRDQVLAKKIEEKRSIKNAYYNILELINIDADSAMSIADSAINNYIQADSTDFYIYSNLIKTLLVRHSSKNNYTLDYLDTAFKYASDSNNTPAQIEVYKQYVYTLYNVDREIAYNYAIKGLELTQQNQDYNNQITFSSYLALIEAQNKGNLDKGIFYVKESIEIAKRLNSNDKIAPQYLILSSIYSQKGMLDSTKVYLDISLEYASKVGSNILIAAIYDEYAQSYYLPNNKIDLADQFTEKAITLTPDFSSNYEQLYELHENLSEIKALKRDYSAALNHLEMATSFKDSLDLSAIKSEIAIHDLVRQIQQNISDVQQHNLEISDKEQVIQKQKQLSYLVSGLIILIIVIAYLVYRSHQNEVKTLELLKLKNEEITSKNDKLEKQAIEMYNINEEIVQMNQKLEAKIEERSELIKDQARLIIRYIFASSHKIRGPLTTIMGLINLHRNNIVDTKSDLLFVFDSITNKANEIDRVIYEMNNILESNEQLLEAKQKEELKELTQKSS